MSDYQYKILSTPKLVNSNFSQSLYTHPANATASYIYQIYCANAGTTNSRCYINYVVSGSSVANATNRVGVTVAGATNFNEVLTYPKPGIMLTQSGAFITARAEVGGAEFNVTIFGATE